MNYTIKTPSANRLKREILDKVSDKKDANGREITTWKCVLTETNDIVLVHTAEQWEEKGCLRLTPGNVGEELQVRFYYWNYCNDENKANGDDRYLLGRFTELVLVHFSYFIDRIVIE